MKIIYGWHGYENHNKTEKIPVSFEIEEKKWNDFWITWLIKGKKKKKKL